MALVDKQILLQDLVRRLDAGLTEQLLSEYISQEKRYVLREWEPAALDGGQFVEAAARIVYHVDSGNLNQRKKVDDCLICGKPPKCACFSGPEISMPYLQGAADYL